VNLAGGGLLLLPELRLLVLLFLSLYCLVSFVGSYGKREPSLGRKIPYMYVLMRV
jgi:hypothetical protein